MTWAKDFMTSLLAARMNAPKKPSVPKGMGQGYTFHPMTEDGKLWLVPDQEAPGIKLDPRQRKTVKSWYAKVKDRNKYNSDGSLKDD